MKLVAATCCLLLGCLLMKLPFLRTLVDEFACPSRQDHYKALGQTVADTKLEHVRAQMAAFKQGLEGFALKHRQA